MYQSEKKAAALSVPLGAPLCAIQYHTSLSFPTLLPQISFAVSGRDRKGQAELGGQYVCRAARRCSEGLGAAVASAIGSLTAGNCSFTYHDASCITESSIRDRWCVSETNAYLEMGS